MRQARAATQVTHATSACVISWNSVAHSCAQGVPLPVGISCVVASRFPTGVWFPASLCMMAESKEQTLKFIEDYRQLECLWNTRLKDYSNKNVRNDALLELDRKYGLGGVKGVKNKIKSLRSYFAKEHDKTQKKPSGSGAGEVYCSTWFAYKHLLFLKDTSNPNETQDTSQHSETQDTSQHSDTQDTCQDHMEDVEVSKHTC